MVEGPFFETSGKVRESIISNISSMSDSDKRKYSYIWKAELVDGSMIVQFDGRGEEQNYGKVREALEKEAVETLYWVPIESGRKGYGLECADAVSDCGLMRRAVINRHQNFSGSACRIQCDQKFLYIGDNGETVVTDDKNLSVFNNFVRPKLNASDRLQ